MSRVFHGYFWNRYFQMRLVDMNSDDIGKHIAITEKELHENILYRDYLKKEKTRLKAKCKEIKFPVLKDDHNRVKYE